MRLILVSWLAVFLMASQAYSAEPYNQRGTWFISWSGIPFAKLWVAIEESADEYHLTATYKSRGLMRLFDSTKSLALSNGASNNGHIQALAYSYEDSIKKSHIALEFDRAGELVRREVEPDDDPAHRPPVAAEEIRGAVVPGSLVFALREAVMQAQTEGKSSFSRRFYEGRRLMQVDAVIAAEPEPYEIKGKTYSVLKLDLSRKLLNGFTDKELKRYKKGEPPLAVYLDAETLFPLAFDIEVKFGALHAEWVAE